METFEPQRLRTLRLRRGRSMTDLAQTLGVSAAQVHRLETGQRRLTVDMLLAYCAALEADVSALFQPSAQVPVIGVVDSEYLVRPLPPNSATQTLAPPLVPDMENVAAVRWEPKGRIEPMYGHLLFFYKNFDGVPDHAWGKRCLVVLKQGTQRLGWPIKEASGMHIDGVEGRSEFNVEITWASPLLAVVPPFLVEQLQQRGADR